MQRVQRMELPLGCGLSEFGPGQFELTLLHRADAGRAVDEAIQFKHTVRRWLAAWHGSDVHGEPYDGQPGNGMHLHMSLLDADGVTFSDDAAEEARHDCAMR